MKVFQKNLMTYSDHSVRPYSNRAAFSAAHPFWFRKSWCIWIRQLTIIHQIRNLFISQCFMFIQGMGNQIEQISVFCQDLAGHGMTIIND